MADAGDEFGAHDELEHMLEGPQVAATRADVNASASVFWLLAIFGITLLLRLIENASTLLSASWLSPSRRRAREILAEQQAIRREMRATNAQREFAKYSRLQRRLNKLDKELDKLGINPASEFMWRIKLRIGSFLAAVVGYLSLLLYSRSIVVALVPRGMLGPLASSAGRDVDAVSGMMWMFVCRTALAVHDWLSVSEKAQTAKKRGAQASHRHQTRAGAEEATSHRAKAASDDSSAQVDFSPSLD